MALLFVAIGYFLDYRYNSKEFKSDLKKSLVFLSLFIGFHIALKYWFHFQWIVIVFFIGIDVLILFATKSFFDEK